MSANEPLTSQNFTLYFGSDPHTPADTLVKFAGLPVTVTMDGLICGYGHMELPVFLSAANHLYRTEVDEQVSEQSLLAHAEFIEHRWAVVTTITNAEEWEISTEEITENTPGAFPVTVLAV